MLRRIEVISIVIVGAGAGLGGVTPTAARAQSITADISLGATHGFGGYDYRNRASTTIGVGADVVVRRLAQTSLLVGARVIQSSGPNELSLVCYQGVRRPCVIDYPVFNSFNLNLGLRRTVHSIGVIDFGLQPTLLRTPSGVTTLFAPGAGLSLTRPLYKATSLLIGSSAVYVSSFQGQQLGRIQLSAGLRIH
jgi:hypothetical protein